MGKVQEIINGWTNYTFKNSKIELIAKNRAEYCANCDKLNQNFNTCKICGCYIPAKIRSTKSKCPLNKW
jgi:hypothetical protein